jgi:hypothetical protein
MFYGVVRLQMLYGVCEARSKKLALNIEEFVFIVEELYPYMDIYGRTP